MNLAAQLTEEETEVMESTRKYCQELLMPRVLEANRNERKHLKEIKLVCLYTKFLLRIR